MTKYEWVRLISDRTAQIANGSSIMIKTGKDTVDVNTLTPKEIAIIELESGRCPLYLVREMPNGQREKWDPNQMIFTKRYLMK
jgi:DNA-directed RNA polymerase subunit K/omega